MHRILSFILILLYSAFFAVGLPLSVHYCGDSVIGVGMYEYEEENCCGDEEEEKDCCYNQNAYIKAASDHPPTFGAGKQMPPVVLFLPASFTTIQTVTKALPGFSLAQTADTGPPAVSRWVLLCTARI